MQVDMNDIILRKDGNMWMCVGGDFIDLAISEAFWGKSPYAAMMKYLAQMETKNV